MVSRRKSKSCSRSRSVSRSRSRSTSRRVKGRKGAKRALTKWNIVIKKAMAQLKKEGWCGKPQDRMKAAAKLAHSMGY